MAKGYNKNKQRNDTINSFGRVLAKRSGSKCELCETKGVKLNIYEVPPVEDEPDLDSCIFICDHCIDSIERHKKVDANNLSFLNGTIWSEVPVIKAISLYLLRELQNEMWAQDILDSAYITDDIEERAGLIKM